MLWSVSCLDRGARVSLSFDRDRDKLRSPRCRVALGTSPAAERERLGPSALATLYAAHKARIAAYWRIEPTPTPVAYVAPPEPEPESEPEFSIEPPPLPLPHLPRPIVQRCQVACSREFSISMEVILSPRREKSYVEARHTSIYLARMCSTLSLPEIGRRTGDRDHATVLNAIRKITRRIGIDPVFAARVAGIRARVEATIMKENP